MYIDSFLDGCLKANIGAKLGSFNFSIICYCDDITLICSSINEMNKLLGLYGKYAKLWKLDFSVEKCNWTVFGKENFEGAKFYLNSRECELIRIF